MFHQVTQCTFHNMYEYTGVHKRGISLNFYVLRIRMLHKFKTRSFVHAWRTFGKYTTSVLVYMVGSLIEAHFIWRSVIMITHGLMIPIYTQGGEQGKL